MTHGLETIRGAAIFALALYAFWTLAIGLYTKRTVVGAAAQHALRFWWVSAPHPRDQSDEWKAAHVEFGEGIHRARQHAHRAEAIAPGYWMLTGASLLVLFIIVKGIVGGASGANPRRRQVGARAPSSLNRRFASRS